MAEIVVLYHGPIVTIKDARGAGEVRYFTGKPCVNGHIQQRIVSSNGCLTCDLNRKKSKYNPVRESEKKKRQKKTRNISYVRKPRRVVSVTYNGTLVNRNEAIEKGFKRYFTGVPCKHGHISERYTSKNQRAGQCVSCSVAKKESKEAERIAAIGRPRPSACDICGRDGSSHGSGKLVYDHCHRSGRFRGWLCNDCNAALGFAKDDPSLLREMATYLERSVGQAKGKDKECASGLFICGT